MLKMNNEMSWSGVPTNLPVDPVAVPGCSSSRTCCSFTCSESSSPECTCQAPYDSQCAARRCNGRDTQHKNDIEWLRGYEMGHALRNLCNLGERSQEVLFIVQKGQGSAREA
jgi:hypothetical protein